MILFSCKRTLLFLCVFTACLSFSIIAANATEVDSYTYTRFLKDGAVFEINDEINRLMEEAIREANQDDIHNSEDLYRILNKFLGELIVTQIEEIIEQKNDGRVLKLDIRDSIYSDMWTFWAPSLMLSQKIGGVFKVDEYIIGTDKLGHFVSQGYTYFKICYLKGEGIEEALLFGINSELTYFGFLTTGIYSYGDLVANFQGLRFWNDILSEHPDILGERQQHYIQKKMGSGHC